MHMNNQQTSDAKDSKLFTPKNFNIVKKWQVLEM